MQTISDLNDLKYVALVAQMGSLAAAARELSVNHATVFRRIEQLEDKIGVRLFFRENGRYTPTLAGEELARVGLGMLNEANDIFRKIAGEDLRPHGLVRITSTESMLRHFLGSSLQRCHAQYPDIAIELNIAETPLNLSKRDADIAIRASLQPPDHLIGRRICTLDMAVYASKEYLLAHNITGLLDSKALAACPWLTLDDSFQHHPFNKWLMALKPLYDIKFSANTMYGLQLACEQGLGCAVLPCFLGDQSAALSRLTLPIASCSSALWVLMHPDLRGTTRVNVVFDIVQQELKRVTAPWRALSAEPM